jgi:hypothetical protein
MLRDVGFLCEYIANTHLFHWRSMESQHGRTIPILMLEQGVTGCSSFVTQVPLLRGPARTSRRRVPTWAARPWPQAAI